MPTQRRHFFVALVFACALSFLNARAASAQSNVASLIEKLSSPDPDVRGEALRALSALPTNAVVPGVLDALNTADRSVAERLVDVLVKHPDPKEIAPLIALAKKYDGLGAEALSALGAPGVRGLLAAAANNCDVTIDNRSFPAWAGETAAQADTDYRPLLREATRASDPCTREAALDGLATVPADQEISEDALKKDASLIVAALADPDTRVWETADRILTLDPPGSRFGNTIDNYSAEPMLNFFAEQKSPEVRVHVLRILASYGDSEVVDLMSRLADDPDPDIREIATGYQPPDNDDTRVEYSDSPQSGITPPAKAVVLQRLIASKNPVDRANAAEQMGKSGDVDNTAPLIVLLHDSDPAVREAAATGLGALNGYFEDAAVTWNGNRDDTAPALYAALDDPSAPVRAAALNSLLGLYPDWAETPEISEPHADLLAKLQKMMTDSDPRVSHEAALAFAHFLLPEDIDESIALLHNANPDVRKEAEGAVANSHDPKGVRPLSAMLKDPDVGVRSEALRNLLLMTVLNYKDDWLQLAAQLPVEPLVEALPQDTTGEVMELLAASPDPAAAKALLEALANVRSYVTTEEIDSTVARRKDPGATPLLLEMIRIPHPSDRMLLGDILDRHDPGVVEPLLEFAKTKEGAWINTDQVLLAFHDPRVVPHLLTQLKDRDESVRVNAAKNLSSFQDDRVVPALIAALQDEAWPVQYAAAASLGKLGDPRAIPSLIAMLDYNPGAAALALGDLKAVQAAPKLAAVLRDPKATNRSEIIRGIAKLPASTAADLLVSAFQQSPATDCSFRETLAPELAKVQDPRVIPVLQKIFLESWKPNGCLQARSVAAAALSQRGAPLLLQP